MADAIMQRAKEAAAAYYRSIGNEIDAELVWAEHGHEYIAVQAAAFALRQPQLPSDDGLIKALEQIASLDYRKGGFLLSAVNVLARAKGIAREALTRHKAPLSVAGDKVERLIDELREHGTDLTVEYARAVPKRLLIEAANRLTALQVTEGDKVERSAVKAILENNGHTFARHLVKQIEALPAAALHSKREGEG